jgi:hypothetical protein
LCGGRVLAALLDLPILNGEVILDDSALFQLEDRR